MEARYRAMAEDGAGKATSGPSHLLVIDELAHLTAAPVCKEAAASGALLPAMPDAA